METPSFTFRLERVRGLRVQAEDQAREELANELSLRMRGEAMLIEAAQRAEAARRVGLATVVGGTTGPDMLAAQAWIERSERRRLDAALELDRRDEQVSARRQSLLEASRERQAIDKLAERREAEHMREWSRRAQGELDEVALAVHRRGSAVR